MSQHGITPTRRRRENERYKTCDLAVCTTAACLVRFPKKLAVFINAACGRWRQSTKRTVHTTRTSATRGDTCPTEYRHTYGGLVKSNLRTISERMTRMYVYRRKTAGEKRNRCLVLFFFYLFYVRLLLYYYNACDRSHDETSVCRRCHSVFTLSDLFELFILFICFTIIFFFFLYLNSHIYLVFFIHFLSLFYYFFL